MAYFGQCISTKSDPFVRSITNHVLENSIHICQEHTLRDRFFNSGQKGASQAPTSYSNFQEAVLQAAYGHLLIRASYRRFDIFSTAVKNWPRDYRLFRANYGTVNDSCSATKLLQYWFFVLYVSVQRTTVPPASTLLVYFAISEQNRFSQDSSPAQAVEWSKTIYPSQFKHPSR